VQGSCAELSCAELPPLRSFGCDGQPFVAEGAEKDVDLLFMIDNSNSPTGQEQIVGQFPVLMEALRSHRLGSVAPGAIYPQQRLQDPQPLHRCGLERCGLERCGLERCGLERCGLERPWRRLVQLPDLRATGRPRATEDWPRPHGASRLGHAEQALERVMRDCLKAAEINTSSPTAGCPALISWARSSSRHDLSMSTICLMHNEGIWRFSSAWSRTLVRSQPS
jgi:hypothetical protein